MPDPKEVNPGKYKVKEILYNHEDFSVSYGIWTPSGKDIVAMRWNDGEDGAGYPKTFGHPQWFVISDHLAKNILLGMLTSNHISNDQYLKILKFLQAMNK